MAVLSDANVKLLVDTSVSTTVAILTQNPVGLASPLKQVLERLSIRIAAANKEAALRRNFARAFAGEATPSEIDAGVRFARDIALKFLDRRLILETRADRDEIQRRLATKVPSIASGVETAVALAALRGVAKNVIDAIQQEPTTANFLAWLEIQGDRDREAEGVRYQADKVDDHHDWTTGFEAEHDRRKLRDARWDRELTAGPVAGLVSALRDSWRQTLHEQLRSLPSPRTEDPLEHYAQAIRGLDTRGTNLSILARLRAPEMQDALSRIGRSGTKSYRTQQDWSKSHSVARWLAQQSSQPEFGLVLPVMGQWGSGKSRLTLEITQSWHLLSGPVLFVKRSTGESLEQAILSSCTEGLGRVAHNRMQLAEYVSGFTQPLLVVLERLDQMEMQNRGSFREFADIVVRWSDTDRFRWIVTTDHNTLVSIPPEDLRNFYPWFGSSSTRPMEKAPVVGGWFDLDSHNQVNTVGLGILQKHGPVHMRSQLVDAQAATAVAPHVLVALASPLPAWVRLEAEDQLPLEDFHGWHFLSTYWTTAIHAMEDSGCSALAIEAYCAAVAALLKEERDLVLATVEESLMRPPGYWPHWPSVVAQVREALLQKGIIAIDGATVHLPLEYAAIWGYRLAQSVLEDIYVFLEGDPKRAGAILAELARRASAGDIRSQCGLGTVVDQLAGLGLLSTEVVSSWLREGLLAWEVLWEAAIGFEDTLLRWLLAEESAVAGAFTSPRHCYLVLRTARLRPSTDPHQALMTLLVVARALPVAKESGLVGYCAMALENQLDSLDWSDSPSSISALGVISLLGEPRYDYTLAESVIALAVKSVGLDEWASRLSVFLRSYEKGKEFPEDHGGMFPGDRDVRDQLPFWRALVRLTFARMFAEHGPKAISDLARMGWLNAHQGAMPAHVQAIIKQEANVAFGHCYRGRYSKEFVEVVNLLADARDHGIDAALQREIALFGIRHSVSTGGQDVLVDAVFSRPYGVLIRNHGFAKEHRKWLQSVEVRRVKGY